MSEDPNDAYKSFLKRFSDLYDIYLPKFEKSVDNENKKLFQTQTTALWKVSKKLQWEKWIGIQNL